MLTAQLQVMKRQAQPQAESVSDIYLFNSICVDIGLNTLKVPTNVRYDIDPHTSHVKTHTRFIISLSCDREPDITMYTLNKFLISDDLDTYVSVVIDNF